MGQYLINARDTPAVDELDGGFLVQIRKCVTVPKLGCSDLLSSNPQGIMIAMHSYAMASDIKREKYTLLRVIAAPKTRTRLYFGLFDSQIDHTVWGPFYCTSVVL